MKPTSALAAMYLAMFSLMAMVGCQLASGEQRLTEPSENALRIDRSLTLADITVTLSELVITEEGVELHHSHGASDPDLALRPVGQPEMVKGDDPIARISEMVAKGDNGFVTSSTWRRRDDGLPNAVDLHMDSFVVIRRDVSGGGQISLGEEYRSRIAADKRNVKVPLTAEITLHGRLFIATEMRLTRDRASTEFTRFVLTITPADGLASITELASVGDANITLTDDAGSSYRWLGTRTLWQRSSESRTIARQELMFAGVPPASVSTLNLNIKGAGEIVGPFVFRDVPLPADGER